MASLVGSVFRKSAQGWGILGKTALGVPGVGARMGMRGAKGALNAAVNHPRLAIGGAVLAGAAVAQAQSALTPNAQEAFLGAPGAFGLIAREQATATMLHGYNPQDRANPYDATVRGGTVLSAPSYLYGRPIQGNFMGDVAGSRVLGGYNIPSSYRNRIRGSGREQPANGAMVFGMYNLRR